MVFDFIRFVSDVFNPILNPVLRPILDPIPTSWAVILMSVIITLITTLVYKKFTNQEVLKSLKEELKEIQAEMKQFSHDVAKSTELQKRSWEKMLQQMKMSMKPMLITWIPILIIFAWIWTNLAFHPILPGEEFSTTVTFEKEATGLINLTLPQNMVLLDAVEKTITDKKASWRLIGEPGTHELSYDYNGKTYKKEVLITDTKLYITPKLNIFEDQIKTIEIDNQPVKIFGLNWFWAYIIISFVINMLLRKLLKIH